MEITVARKPGWKNPPVGFLWLWVWSFDMIIFCSCCNYFKICLNLPIFHPLFQGSCENSEPRVSLRVCHGVYQQEDCMGPFPVFHRSMGGYLSFGQKEISWNLEDLKLYQFLIFWKLLAYLWEVSLGVKFESVCVNLCKFIMLAKCANSVYLGFVFIILAFILLICVSDRQQYMQYKVFNSMQQVIMCNKKSFHAEIYKQLHVFSSSLFWIF